MLILLVHALEAGSVKQVLTVETSDSSVVQVPASHFPESTEGRDEDPPYVAEIFGNVD